MGRKFHRGFVVIPTDLSSDPSICEIGYGSLRIAFHGKIVPSSAILGPLPGKSSLVNFFIR
ncbi:hypothetical protein [Leptospira alexanderi]|uniref:hypothetical protein n=1 Tax=Leptospira alexanderi TaxID=100053 RepID=UPI003CC818D7